MDENLNDFMDFATEVSKKDQAVEDQEQQKEKQRQQALYAAKEAKARAKREKREKERREKERLEKEKQAKEEKEAEEEVKAEPNSEDRDIDAYLKQLDKEKELEKNDPDKKKKDKKKVKARRLVAGVDFPKQVIPELTKKRELDSDFIKEKSKLDAPPNFDEIQEYVEDHEILQESLKLLRGIYEKKGQMLFSKMVEHDLITVQRDPDSNRRIPVVSLKDISKGSEFDERWEPDSSCVDSDGNRLEKSDDDHYMQATLKYGQPQADGGLNGIGRKIILWSGGAGIWEGQYKDDLLHGFGRGIAIYGKGQFSLYIGMWEQNDYHGYGRLNVPITKYNMEGFFENGEYKINGDGIKSYDRTKDKIAHGVKLDKYVQVNKKKTDEGESEAEKITPFGWDKMRENYEEEII